MSCFRCVTEHKGLADKQVDVELASMTSSSVIST